MDIQLSIPFPERTWCLLYPPGIFFVSTAGFPTGLPQDSVKSSGLHGVHLQCSGNNSSILDSFVFGRLFWMNDDICRNVHKHMDHLKLI